MSAAARAAAPARLHCLPPAVRRAAPAPLRGCPRRAALPVFALRAVAASLASAGSSAHRKRSSGGDRDRRSLPSLDEFLAEQGGAGVLLGFAMVHAESGTRLGTVREVLTVAGGEVVFKASGESAAATDEEQLLNALAGFGDWGAAATSSAESTLLRVEGTGCVPSTPPPLRCSLRSAPAAPPRRREYRWEFFFPLAPALVPAVDTRSRSLRVLPPIGLLDAGDAERLLDWLRTELEPYLKRPKSDPTGTRCVASCSAHALCLLHFRVRSLYMPPLTELRRLGRNDIIMAMDRAGGCSTVAAQLRLLGMRKPVGYWDEPEILEQCVIRYPHACACSNAMHACRELREFVATQWKECYEEGDDARPFYHNTATGEMRLVMPRCMRRARVQSDSSSEGEDEEEEEEDEEGRIMPSTTAMQKAGRYDLYKAVTMFGGVAEVAEMLDWRLRLLARDVAEDDGFASFAALAAELRAFAAKAGTPGLMPRWGELAKAGRADVVAAVRNRGGFAAVAKRTGLNVRSSVTLTLPQTVAGLRNYLMETTELGASPRLDMPTDSELKVRASQAFVNSARR